MQNIAFNDIYNMDPKHTREEGRRMPYYRIVVTRHGGPEVLHFQEEELPEPAPGMVRIRVLTCGVSFTDVLIREGTYPGAPSPPFTSGYNLVGVVDRVGEGVSTLSVLPSWDICSQKSRFKSDWNNRYCHWRPF